MECTNSYTLRISSHKHWRRKVKKERRRRLRQLTARARDEEAERLRKQLEEDPDYVLWLKDQEEIKAERQKREEEEHVKAEQAWLDAEVCNIQLNKFFFFLYKT